MHAPNLPPTRAALSLPVTRPAYVPAADAAEPAPPRSTFRHLGARNLLGRETVTRGLCNALERTAAGQCGCVVVDGTAGMGKSRLLAAAVADAAAHEMVVAHGKAIELDRAAPLAALRRLLQAVDAPVLELPDLTIPDRDPLKLIDQVRESIEKYLQGRPLLVALDDAHWADEATALALRVLVPGLRSSPVLWLFTRRPTPTNGCGQKAIDWLIREGAQRYELAPLPAEVIGDLCQDILGASPDPSVLAIASRCEGNPFLLEQLLTTLRETGQLVVRDGTAEAMSSNLTPTFTGAVEQRLLDLSDTTRRLLDVGSVLARPFTVHQLAGLMECSPIELLPSINEVVNAGILVDDGSRLIFQQELIREALYDRLPGPIRGALHREAARVLGADGISSVEVAEHLIRSGYRNDSQAVALLRRVVEQLAPSAPNTAADLILRMLDLLDEHHPDRPQLIAQGVRLLALTGGVPEAIRLGESALHTGMDPDAEVALLLGLSEALLVVGRGAALLHYTGRGLEKARSSDPARAELLAIRASALLEPGDGSPEVVAADAAGAEAAALGTALEEYSAAVCGVSARSTAALLRGELTSAVDLADQATRIADRVGGEARRRHPRLWQAAALTAVDRFDEAHAVLNEDQRDADHLATVWAQPQRCHHRALLLAAEGRLDDAMAEAEAGLLVTGQLSAEALSVPLLALLAQLATHRDDLSSARAYLKQASAIVKQYRATLPADLAWASAQLRDAYGQPAASAMEPLTDIGTTHQVALFTREPEAAARMVDLANRAKITATARAAAAVALQLADRNRDVPSLVGAAAHAQGLVHEDIDALRGAVRAYQDSPRPMAGAAAMEQLAQCEHAARRHGDAVTLLEEAHRRYHAAGAHRHANRVRIAMTALGIRRSWRQSQTPRGTGWQSLTDAELRVVRLVAQGLTNREVANRLFLSPHTIDSHLRHSFSKLGVTNRVELTRRVLDQDTDDSHAGA